MQIITSIVLLALPLISAKRNSKSNGDKKKMMSKLFKHLDFMIIKVIRDHQEQFPIKYRYKNILENHRIPKFQTRFCLESGKNRVTQNKLKEKYAELGIPLQFERHKRVKSRLVSQNRHSRRNRNDFDFQVNELI